MGQQCAKCGATIPLNRLHCDCGWSLLAKREHPDLHRKKSLFRIFIGGVVGAIGFGFGCLSLFIVMFYGSRMNGGPHGGPSYADLAYLTALPAVVGFAVGAGVVMLYRGVRNS
jgi:hypothetical protein